MNYGSMEILRQAKPSMFGMVAGMTILTLIIPLAHGSDMAINDDPSLTLIIPLVEGLEIDGVMDEGFYQDVQPLKMVQKLSGETPSQPTTVYLGCDRDNLYVTIECMESEVASMLRKFSHSEERDSAIWNDDCVELLIDPYGYGGNQSYHITINSNGIFYDAAAGVTDFDCAMQLATKVYADRWVVEARLPFSAFGTVPGGPDRWRMNFGRGREGAAVKEYSSLFVGKGASDDPSRFRNFAFQIADEDNMALTVDSVGAPGNYRFNVANGFEHDLQLQVEIFNEDGVKTGSVEGTVAAKAPGQLLYEYDQLQGAMVRLELRDLDSNGLMYTNTYTPLSSRQVLRAVGVTIDPLFEELLSNEYPARIHPSRGLIWGHGTATGVGTFTQFALQFGLPYVGDDFMKLLGDSELSLIVFDKSFDVTMDVGRVLEHNLGVAAIVHVNSNDFPRAVGRNLLFDPAVQQRYHQQLEALRKWKGRIQYFFIGDELNQCDEMILVELFNSSPEYEFVQQADREIKERYGNNVYGIPSGHDDPEPLKWIATRRWMNDQYLDFYQRVYDQVKEIDPAILVISDDPAGAQGKVYAYADMASTADIFTHQLYPRGSEHIDSFGFLTKYMKDLTGAEEIWPCPHIEHYADNFNSEQTLELLSSVIRCGGNGFKYYLADTIGVRSGVRRMHTDIFGAPQRFGTAVNAVKLLNRMPKLKFPDPDVALYSAVDSLRAQPGFQLKVYPSFDTFLHGYLSKAAGVWYRCVNEVSIERDQNLAEYKLIVSAENEFIEPAALAQLQQAVENGATLLLANPLAFSRTPQGDDLSLVRSDFSGVKAVEVGRSANTISYGNLQLPAANSTIYDLTLDDDVEVVGRFEDGRPAIVSKQYGRGRVLTLATNPCIAKLAGNRGYRQFFRAVATDAGAQLDQDIWRFRLPDQLIPPRQQSNGRCISGNAAVWEYFTPDISANGAVAGRYRWINNPDVMADVSEGYINFADGKLFDRLRAIDGGNCEMGRSKLSDWVVGFSTPEAIELEVELPYSQELSRLNFCVKGYWRGAEIIDLDSQLPVVTVYPDDNINRYSDNVRIAEVPFSAGTRLRKFMVRLLPVPADMTISPELILGEMEIWAP